MSLPGYDFSFQIHRCDFAFLDWILLCSLQFTAYSLQATSIQELRHNLNGFSSFLMIDKHTLLPRLGEHMLHAKRHNHGRGLCKRGPTALDAAPAAPAGAGDAPTAAAASAAVAPGGSRASSSSPTAAAALAAAATPTSPKERCSSTAVKRQPND